MQPVTHTYRQQPDEHPDHFRVRVKRLLAARFAHLTIVAQHEQRRGSRLCVVVQTKPRCHGVAGRS